MKITKRKRCKNAVGGVVHAAIQIAIDSDLSTEQRRLRVQHTYNPGTSPPSRSSKGRGEVEGELRQHDGVVVMELVVLRQGFAKRYGGGGGVGEGEGLRQGKGAAALPPLSIYRVKVEGAGPPRCI